MRCEARHADPHAWPGNGRAVMLAAAPTFSVIIPTHDRPQALARCLHSLRSLAYPVGAWELIVVNDGGIEPSAGLEEGLKSSLPLRLHSIRHLGASGARNAGARLATSEFLAFLDDDCRAEPDWLEQLAGGFGQTDWAALGGRSMNPRPDNLAMVCWHYLIDFLYSYLQDEHGNALLLVSNNVAYRRSVFEDLGGFDEGFRWAEDRDLSIRLLTAGHGQAYLPQARVWHDMIGPNGWGYLRQQFNYGRGAYTLERKLRRTGLVRRFPALAPQGRSFRVALWRSLWARRMPLAVWLMINTGQLSHRLGKHYEALRP